MAPRCLHEDGESINGFSAMDTSVSKAHPLACLDSSWKVVLVGRPLFEFSLGPLKGEGSSLFFEQQRHGLLRVPYRVPTTADFVVFLSLISVLGIFHIVHQCRQWLDAASGRK